MQLVVPRKHTQRMETRGNHTLLPGLVNLLWFPTPNLLPSLLSGAVRAAVTTTLLMLDTTAQMVGRLCPRQLRQPLEK
jgi:hypothetical protein